MATIPSSVRNLIHERRYPFIFILFLLFLSVTLLLLSPSPSSSPFSLSSSFSLLPPSPHLLESPPPDDRDATTEVSAPRPENREASSEDRVSTAEERSPPPEDRAAPVKDTAATSDDRASTAEVRTEPSNDRAAPAKDVAAPADDRVSPEKDVVAPADDRDAPAEDRAEEAVVAGEIEFDEELTTLKWEACKGGKAAVDYIPCLDNWKAIKALKSRRHMEHRERHCPKPSPRCLVPLPKGYKVPIPWPQSRDMIWYDNVPHPKLVDYKKDQHWVVKSEDYFIFPGGGTQFKEGVTNYIDFIENNVPVVKWGKNIRVILDVGCGVASFGGHLLDRGVLTMSLAPKDEHEAQIQFALERGIPAALSVIGTQQLTFPDNAYDLIHCARCRVHWDADGGKPLLELNRILRPGGFFIWSATPVYRQDERDVSVWNSMVALTKSMCWKVVAKTMALNGVGLVVYQKPDTESCYKERKKNIPPMCEEVGRNISWYTPLQGCLPQLPPEGSSWPPLWPKRLTTKPESLPSTPLVEGMFNNDTRHWSALVSDVYLGGLGINWTTVRNVMDMTAGHGGFAAALINMPVWVMNVIPVHEPDRLPIIFDRGLIGVYHDWCESFNTYPRTYDLLHSNFLFSNLPKRCDVIELAVEMDRIVRPGGWILVQESKEMINKIGSIFRSLQWSVNLYNDRYLVGKKSFWRPVGGQVQR